MTMLQATSVAPAQSVCAAAIKRLLHYWENRQKRRALAQLCSLNPRILRDFGIDRSELTSIVYGDSKGRRRRCAENLAAPWAGR